MSTNPLFFINPGDFYMHVLLILSKPYRVRIADKPLRELYINGYGCLNLFEGSLIRSQSCSLYLLSPLIAISLIIFARAVARAAIYVMAAALRTFFAPRLSSSFTIPSSII